MIKWIEVFHTRPDLNEPVLAFLPWMGEKGTVRILDLKITPDAYYYWKDPNTGSELLYVDSEGSYVVTHWAKIRFPEVE